MDSIGNLAHLHVRNKLSKNMISSYILSPIAHGYEPPLELVRALGIQDELYTIRNIFNRYSENEAIDGRPRFLPFYRYIKDNFSSFDWKEKVCEGQVVTLLNKPYIDNKRPTLLELILAAIKGYAHTTPHLKVKYKCLAELPNELVADFEGLIHKHSLTKIPHQFMAEIAAVLAKGLQGEQISLISPVCPDYSFEENGGKYRYTFTSLGEDIGLVASRVVKVLPDFAHILSRHGMNVKVVVAAGDFEGLDSGTLKSVGETYETFRRKVEISQQKILEAMGMPAESISITDECGGPEGWISRVSATTDRLQQGQFGGMIKEIFDPDAIFKARLPLYRAWYREATEEELKEVLYKQGAEYAVMGQLFNERFQNPLVIGADHNKMMPFYWFHGCIPVAYLKRIY